MNKRIQQLIEQATKVIEPNDPDYRHEIFDEQKFAELIIKECIQAVYDDGQDAEYYQNRIKERFGVEE